MLSGISILCIAMSALVCLALPSLAAVLLILKQKASWKAFVVGAAAFIISQPLLRIPILGQLQNTAWYALFSTANPILFIIVLALSAGVFEETARFLGIRFFLRKNLNWKNGIVFGLGHGGAEAFLLVGLSYVKLLVQAATGQAAATLADTPPYLFLVGGMERILAVCAHIGMTMLVFYAVKYKKFAYFLYAILFHTLLDCSTTILQDIGVKMNVWSLEGTVAIFAVLAVLVAMLLKAPMDREAIEAVPLPKL